MIPVTSTTAALLVRANQYARLGQPIVLCLQNKAFADAFERAAVALRVLAHQRSRVRITWHPQKPDELQLVCAPNTADEHFPLDETTAKALYRSLRELAEHKALYEARQEREAELRARASFRLQQVLGVVPRQP